MADGEALVAVFYSHMAAEDAIRRLHLSGYDVKRLSIVLQGDTLVERVAGFYTAQERIRSWGKTGAVCGAAVGLLAGTALVMIPGIEAGTVGGSVLSWVRGALGAAVAIGGLSALSAGVYSFALPKDSVLKFEPQVEARNEKFLLMARGTATEAAAARRSLWDGAPRGVGGLARTIGESETVAPRQARQAKKQRLRDPLRNGALPIHVGAQSPFPRQQADENGIQEQ